MNCRAPYGGAVFAYDPQRLANVGAFAQRYP